MESLDIIVVGGGLSGLTAAVVAHEAGARVLVLEAGGEIGGRIQCVTDQATGRAIADLGPTWVWPSYQPVVLRWLQRLGIETFPQFNDGDGVLDGWSREVERLPMPEQDGIRRIPGGPSTLVFALARRLPAPILRVRETVVSVGEGHGGALGVALASGERLFASRVILATPLRVTAHQIALPDIDPDLRRALERTPTWMATQAKVVAVY
ncbi:MAG: FAD-dependent oxidoreductase, partial [Gemmatimonadaceae bacterium]